MTTKAEVNLWYQQLAIHQKAAAEISARIEDYHRQTTAMVCPKCMKKAILSRTLYVRNEYWDNEPYSEGYRFSHYHWVCPHCFENNSVRSDEVSKKAFDAVKKYFADMLYTYDDGRFKGVYYKSHKQDVAVKLYKQGKHIVALTAAEAAAINNNAKKERQQRRSKSKTA